MNPIPEVEQVCITCVGHGEICYTCMQTENLCDCEDTMEVTKDIDTCPDCNGTGKEALVA